jgi:GT2 family glycosyltransferase
VTAVAVIVVSWNSGEWLAKAVNSVFEQTQPARRVIVVDNASSDGSIASLAGINRKELDVIRLKRNIGFAAANNVGLQRCGDSKWIALLNPDAFAQPQWLENLVRASRRHPDYQSFACRQIMANDHSVLDGVGDAYHVSGAHWRLAHGKSVNHASDSCEVFSPCGAAAFFRADVLREVGGFDESFFCYGEDIDLGFRLRLRGYRCRHVPDAVVHHVGSATTGRRSDFAVYHGHRNLVWIYVKNMPTILMLIYGGAHLLLNILSIVWYMVRGRGAVIVKAKRDALRGLPQVLRERKKIQAQRTVSVWQLRSAMTRGLSGVLSRRWMSE